MAKVVKDAEEKLGEDRIEKILDKEWKISELPTEEELRQEVHESPKARSNPNSRANLAQYRKRTKEEKEAAINQLKFTEKEEDIDPQEVLGDFSRIDVIEKLMPALDVLKDRKEQEIYYNYIRLILSDFDADDLTASDIDDIVTLALNRVIEYRLLKISTKNPKLVLEAAPAIEKFRKFSEKTKSTLANRRVDRVDLKNKPTFSILDLAAHLDEQENLDFERRVKELKEGSDNYSPPKRDAEGYLVDDE